MPDSKKASVDWRAVGRRLRELRGFDVNQATLAREVWEVDGVGAYGGRKVGHGFCGVRSQIYQEMWVSYFARFSGLELA